MNFNFLPSKVREELGDVLKDNIPISVTRTSGSIEGESGEGYVVAFKDKVYLFSRRTGDRGFLKLSGTIRDDLASLALRREKYDSFLDINLGGKDYSVKFSSFEEKDIGPLIDAWQKAHDTVGSLAGAEPEPQTEESVESSESKEEAGENAAGALGTLEPLVVMASAMMFVSNADEKISKQEDEYILRVMKRDYDILQPGLAFYKEHSFEELLAIARNLTREQNLCVLANMLEIAMADGVLRSTEQKLIDKFVEGTALSTDEFNTVKQVLIIKNNLGVFNNRDSD